MSTPDFSPLPPGEGQGEGLSLLIENFAAIAAAPGGIKKLRELILELAVRGKLVAQDSGDEPASELIDLLLEKKAKLLESGNVRRGKNLVEDPEGKDACRSPLGWESRRLGEIAYIQMGNSPPGDSYNDHGAGVPLINGPVEFSKGHFGATRLEKYTTAPTYMCESGDLLVCVRGATTGRTNIAAFPACIGRGVALIRGWDAQPYINLFMWKIGSQLLAAGKGTTFPSISFVDLATWPIAVPPLAEQHRIVTKVDELMALCDRLESGQADSERAHQQLVTELLATLTQSASPEDFAANWQRLSQHFDTLFTTEASIDALKQTILQLAVMGRLVPQDPNDESATKHLQEVGKKNIGETRSGKFSKGMIGTEIGGNESPYEIPDGWVLIRFGDAVEFLNGYAFKGEWFSPSGIRLLRNINVSHGVACWDALACVSKEKAAEYDRWSLAAGDVVLSLDRPLITSGLKYAVVREVDLPCLLLQRVAKLTPIRGVIDQRFLVVWLTSPLFTQTIDPGRSNGVPHISTNQVSAMPFLLPPLAEQHRIVTKVDELMSLCDALKSRLTESRAAQEKLYAVLVEQSLVNVSPSPKAKLAP